MNKTTGLTIPQLKIIMCVGTKAQDEKNALNHNKTNHGHKFNIQYSQLLTLSLLTEKNLSSIQPNLCVANLQNVNFCSQPCTRYAITKATEYIMLSFSFPILVSFPF